VDIPEFPYNTAFMVKKTQLDSSSRFDTMPVCDRQTDGRKDRHPTTAYRGAYRADIASRGKMSAANQQEHETSCDFNCAGEATNSDNDILM